jgi:hypothetical protein
VRFDVRWTLDRVRMRATAWAALRHGIQALEDHLASQGFDDAELDLHIGSSEEGAADLKATLRVRGITVVRNAQDLDEAYGLTRLLADLRDDPALDDAAPTPIPGFGEPWALVTSQLQALAHHAVHRAVDLGDLPAGAIDPDDLADEVLTVRLESRDDGSSRPLMSRLRAELRRRLNERIDRLAERQDDVALDAPADPVVASGSLIEEDPYVFDQPDETKLKNEDVIG